MSPNADLIRARAGTEPPELAVILGSGLAGLADAVAGITIPYADLDGFPPATVPGHAPKLVIGRLEGCRIAILAGRAHYYESGRADAMRPVLETLRDLGCRRLILTNAAGSCRAGMPPGSVMLVCDHINFIGRNPLIGEASPARFTAMTDAYDPGLRAALAQAARTEGIALPEGVYCWFSGPSFETPAEIRAARTLGADAVGMSTVPEVILACFLGLRVAALSVITNMGAGLSDEVLSHAHTQAMAAPGSEKLARILRRALRDGL